MRIALWRPLLAAGLVVASLGLGGRASAQDGVWTTATPLPNTDANGEAAVIDGELYWQGSAQPNLEIYDPANGTWVMIAPVPADFASSRLAAAVGDRFYITGGCENGDCNSPTSAMQIYDAPSNAWSTGPSAPVALSFRSGGVINGKIYAVGGSKGNFPGGASSELDVFDPVAGTWTTKSAMPTARLDAASAVVNGKLYVAGGISGNAPGFTMYSTLEIYDPASDAWTTGASLPVPLWGPMGAEANGFFYTVGGITSVVNGQVIYTNAVYAYNPGSGTWTSVTPIPVSGGIYGGGLASINGKLFAVGGFTASGILASVEVFTPSTTSGFAQLNGGNTSTGNQTITGSVNATSFSGDGSALTNVTATGLFCAGCVGNTQLGVNYAGSASQGGPATSALAAVQSSNALDLGGVAAGNYARLDTGNNFTGNQAINGNVAITGTASTTRSITIGDGGTPITGHLSSTFDPTFPALKPGACTSASFPFTGARDGDTTALGLPNTRMTGGGSIVYTAWVSAADTITIQACNANASPQKTAGAGTIRLDIWKH